MISSVERGPFGKPDREEVIQEPQEQQSNSEKEAKKADSLVNPDELGKKDREELENSMKGAMSSALLDLFQGKNKEGLLNVVERHDKDFVPNKMKEIEDDAKAYVKEMPGALRDALKSPDWVKEFVGSFPGADETGVREQLDKILLGLEKSPDFRQAVEDRYVEKRLHSLMGGETSEDKEEKELGDPYQETERRLVLAQEKLVKEGFAKDAENLAETIERFRRNARRGEEASPEFLLWANFRGGQKTEPTGIDKAYDKVNLWLEKIPLLGRYMSKDYHEPVRENGGVIVRTNGDQEEFFTFTRFKKPGEKTHTEALFGGDYDYIDEPQPGDEIVSWEPTEQAKKIIMETLGGANISTPNEFASSIGNSGIKYKRGDFFEDNVKFEVKRGEVLGTGQFFSRASLYNFPKKILNK